ncbi:taspase, threonine aspartase, 1 [Nowakowskiella sp. JEL0407]|nr:taspase, threonine aspartase, 1 [Nowakowskiella sp. JEL0407]
MATQNSNNKLHKPIIILHAGAGSHSPKSTKSLKHLLENTTNRVYQYINHRVKSQEMDFTSLAVDAVTLAISLLEDTELTNAGYGSNLTLNGRVECDATICNGATRSSGSVTNISRYKNPIRIARQILLLQPNENNSIFDLLFGRVPPILIAGDEGVVEIVKFMTDRVVAARSESPMTKRVKVDPQVDETVDIHNFNISQIDNSELISPTAKRKYESWKELYSLHESKQLRKLQRDTSELYDTVGCIILDPYGNIASGVSSGGIFLKFPGRVGEAALVNSGCYARNATLSTLGVAVSVSGVGETIMKVGLAEKLAEEIARSDGNVGGVIDRTMAECISDNDVISKDQRLVGFVSLVHDRSEESEVSEIWYSHTTPSFCLSWAKVDEAGEIKIKTKVSRKAEGKYNVVEGCLL